MTGRNSESAQCIAIPRFLSSCSTALLFHTFVDPMKTRSRRSFSGSDIQQALEDTPATLTVQKTLCRSFKPYDRKAFDVCRACTRSNTLDCRFHNIRGVNRSDTLRRIPHFVNYHGPDTLSKYFQRGRIRHVHKERKHLLSNIRKGLYQLLQADVKERKQHGNKVRRRPPTDGDRHICDLCSTTLFNAHYMCAICGLDMCPWCYNKEWDRKMAQCSFRRLHDKSYMVPMEKLNSDMLDKILQQCDMDIDELMSDTNSNVKCQNDCDARDTTSTDDKDSIPVKQEDSHEHNSISAAPCKDDDHMRKDGKPMCNNTISDTVIHRYSKDGFLDIDATLLTLDVFQHYWKQGKPVQVRNAMMSNNQRAWSPKNFIRKYGEQVAEVIDCNTGERQDMQVETFFRGFDNPVQRPGYDPLTKTWPIYKIKVKAW